MIAPLDKQYRGRTTTAPHELKRLVILS